MDTMNCPLCQNEFEPWIAMPADWRRPRNGGEHKLFWCSRCAFGQLGPRPDPETIASFYAIDDYYTHETNSSASKPARTFSQRLRTHLAWRSDKSVDLDTSWIKRNLPETGKDVCDLGCGSGELLGKLRDAGHGVLGVEPDPAARKVAKEKKLHVLPGTAESLPPELAGRRFDAVFMSHVLEHCRDPLAALRNARNLLKPGGRLIVETPNNSAKGLRNADAAWYWLDVPRHLNFFTPDSLKRSFAKTGLEVEATEFRGYARQFSSDWIKAEQTIWDRLNDAEPNAVKAPRNSEWHSWRLLSATAFSDEANKYDSVRVIARESASQKK